MTYKNFEQYTNETQYDVVLTHLQIKNLLQALEDNDIVTCHDTEEILLNAKEKVK